jgi:arylamine N-acetyltransferase
MAARPAPEGRHALRDAAYSLHRADGSTHEEQLGSVQALKAVLRDRFLIEPPESAQTDARLARLFKH